MLCHTIRLPDERPTHLRLVNDLILIAETPTQIHTMLTESDCHSLAVALKIYRLKINYIRSEGQDVMRIAKVNGYVCLEYPGNMQQDVTAEIHVSGRIESVCVDK